MTIHGEVPSWVADLTGDNFLAIYDVGLDIRQELQMTEEPTIPLLQPAVKFSALLPMDSINMRDRYCDLRWKATGLLKKQGIIREFRLLEGLHRWQGRLKIYCDANKVNSFMKIMDSEFTRRTQPERTKNVSAEMKTRTPREERERIPILW
jgi:hypothetical protein